MPTSLAAVCRRHPMHHHGACTAEATTITTGHVTEIFIRCVPVVSGTSKHRCGTQSGAIYKSLATLLEQAGADMGDVVIERAFFRNIETDLDDFQQVRAEAYRRRGVTRENLPATTYVQQPPCRPGQDIELQAYAVVPQHAGRYRIESIACDDENASIKMVEMGGAKHLYIGNLSGNLSGHCDNGDSDSFRRQSDRMFQRADEILKSHGTSFRDVVRTWIYLDDIDCDYAELNASRNAFFKQEGVKRLPASTGIGGISHPTANRCTLDVYALLNPEIAEIEIMKTPTLNEAHEYGSAFSRGMRMTLPEQTYLFISGTASVDEAGATVHVDDEKGQIERMLLNIEELLRPHGAGWSDVTQAVTFLKSADYLQMFQEVCAIRHLADVPNTIVEADVCRPDLLCEMEAIAVIPTQG